MVYTLPGGEAVLRTLPADAAIRNLPVAPRPPLPSAPLPRIPLPAAGAGAAAAGGGAAGGAAASGSAAGLAGAIGAGVAAFGAGFVVGDAVAQVLGIEYPGGKNALQYFLGPKNPGIGAIGANNAPIPTNFEGEPPFSGGQMVGVGYAVTYEYNTVNTLGGLVQPPKVVVDSAGGGGFTGPITRIERRGQPGSYQAILIHGPGFESSLGSSSAPQGGFENLKIVAVQRVDGQPDSGGDPSGEPIAGTLPSRSGAPLTAAPTAPAPTPTPTTAPNKTAPATPGEPINPPEERDPLLPPWLDPLTAIGVAVGAAAGLAGSPAPGSNVSPVNTPATGSTGDSPPPPTKVKTGNDCKCNIPLMNKIDALDNKLNRSLGGASLAADGGIFAYLVKMQTFAEKAWAASRIQKVLNALTLITVLHNASMISRDVGETLGQALAQGLDVLGIEDEKGQTLDVNGWFGKQANSFFEGIFGAETWRGINATWNKANRIISSASAIVWTIRSINDGTQEVLEWTAENTGKIGNALKKWGVVGERAYPAMAERVKAQDAYRQKFSRILDGLETADDTASSLAMVTSNVKEIQEEVGELGQQRENFTKAVRELTPGTYPDNSDIPATTTEAKINATAGPEVTPVDMEPAASATP